MKITQSICTLALLATLSSTALGVVILTERFDYPDGLLAGSGGWTANAAPDSKVQVSGGAAILASGAGNRQDLTRGLGMGLDGGKIYASFDVTVTSFAGQSYFTHFQSADSSAVGRVWVTSSSSGGDFSFGVSDNTILEGKIGTNLVFGTTYKLVVGYDYDTGISQLWVNPTSEASDHVSTTTAAPSVYVENIALRQGVQASGQIIDNLVVATTFSEVAPVPEPSSVVLALLGAGFLLRRRR